MRMRCLSRMMCGWWRLQMRGGNQQPAPLTRISEPPLTCSILGLSAGLGRTHSATTATRHSSSLSLYALPSRGSTSLEYCCAAIRGRACREREERG